MSFLVGGRYGHADGAVGRHMAFEIDRAPPALRTSPLLISTP